MIIATAKFSHSLDPFREFRRIKFHFSPNICTEHDSDTLKHLDEVVIHAEDVTSYLEE